MQITKKLDAIDPTGWKRKAVRSLDVEITLESDQLLRVHYFYVNGKLENCRNYMRAGYLEDRLEWLGIIANALQQGWPIPEDDFNELVAALQKIATGAKPSNALGLQPKRGRKKNASLLEKQHKIAEDIYHLNHRGHPLSVEGSTATESAFLMAAKMHKVHERAAREAWAIFGETVREFWETGAWQEKHPSVDKLTQKAKQQARNRSSKRVPRK